MSTKLHIAKVEDHEGFGRCGHCDREGLRWIIRLSDGSGVGTECAKRVLGFAPSPKSYNWVAGCEVVAEHSDKWETATVYRNAKGRTILAVNGHAVVIGAGLVEFNRRYPQAVAA